MVFPPRTSAEAPCPHDAGEHDHGRDDHGSCDELSEEDRGKHEPEEELEKLQLVHARIEAVERLARLDIVLWIMPRGGSTCDAGCRLGWTRRLPPGAAWSAMSCLCPETPSRLEHRAGTPYALLNEQKGNL